MFPVREGGTMAMAGALIAGAAVWGAGTGLLVPRAVYQLSVPAGEPWQTRCPRNHPLKQSAGGWIGLPRCPHDAVPLGPPAGVTAAVVAVVCAALAAATGWRPELAAWLLLVPAGAVLTLVDLAVQRLPHLLTLPAAGVAWVTLGVAALLPGHAGSWPHAAAGSLAFSGTLFALFLISPAAMGFGDVLLALTAGAVLGWYGWTVLFLGAFLGFVLASLFGALRRLGRRTAGAGSLIPLGPFLLAGALAGVLAAA
ncbi:prepilin peptidase [Streptomyces sp. P8-A8]|uniref:prepilin peptidase n=2 Tax=unclassified Streptomyces TaxID=2593676 RepID=UPI0036DAABAD